MSSLVGLCPSEAIENVCRICETNRDTLGSIICAEDDVRMLEKIYKSANVRVQPRNGIITPVCEACRTRIDEYDENFKPHYEEYCVDAVNEDGAFKSSSNPLTDPLADNQTIPNHHSTSEGNKDSGNLSERTSPIPIRLPVRNISNPRQIRANTKKASECTICGKLVKFMTVHMKTHSAEKRYKCRLCDKSFAQSNSLTYHVRKHSQEKPFRCDLCNKTFICSAHLKSHLKFHNRSESFLCEICARRFNQLSNLRKHQRVHTGDKPYSCSFCDKKFSNPSNKTSHEKRHRGQRDYTCGICSKRYYDMNHLERHRIVHRNKQIQSCCFCPKTFTTTEGLRKHFLLQPSHETHLHDDDIPNGNILKCGLCSRTFAKVYQLRNHRCRVDEITKPCAKSSRFEIDTETVRKQLGAAMEAPFICSVCQKQFTFAYNLRMHLRVHMDCEKPFRCEQCSRTFNQKVHLKAHERTHTGEKPFCCALCDARFSQKVLLRTHQLKCHSLREPEQTRGVKSC